VITYDVLRHADAPRVGGIYTDWKTDSRYRNLSSLGVSQALALHNQYNTEGVDIRLGLHSPAHRTMYTLAIAVAGRNIPRMQVDELFTPGGKDGEILNAAFEKLGNNLAGYLADDILYQTLVRFGENAARKIQGILDTLMPDMENGVVVIANHAVSGNFVAWALAGWKSRETCLSTNLGEAGRLRVCGDAVKHIPLR
jgi:broad specificity phosphatase PhoE